MTLRIPALALSLFALGIFSVQAHAQEEAIPGATSVEIVNEAEVEQELNDLYAAQSEELSESLGEEEAARWARPRRPLPPRYRPIPRRGWHTCYAQNGRGLLFRASGFAAPRNLQWEAMRYCQYNSGNPRSCRPLGCRR